MITADTNVFVYLWDNSAPEKTAVALQLTAALGDGNSAIGLQVVGELQNVLRRKLKQPPWEAAQNARNLLTTFETFVASEANANEALALMSAGRMSYWDALLVTSARDAGCTTFLTEDMADGMRLGALEIINPFGSDGLSDRALALLKL
jgi:predicted nucleic acid-binding protein